MPPSTGQPLRLRCGSVTATIDPARGARIASLRLGEIELLTRSSDPLTSGCYPMVPWCGRVRDSVFSWRGNNVHLEPTDPPHALHGLGCRLEWVVVAVTAQSVTMTVELDGLGWPLGGVATHTIKLADHAVCCDLTVETSSNDLPAQIGWHPCFRSPSNTALRFAQMYRRETDGIASGLLGEPTDGPWDDCFVGPLAPPTVDVDGVRVEIASDCDRWVVYNQLPGVVCVEPQSGPPNGFNHVDVEPGTLPPYAVVGPATPLHRSMTLAVSSVR